MMNFFFFFVNIFFFSTFNISFFILKASENGVGRRTDTRWSALHEAAYAGHLEIVNFLLENGAIVDLVGVAGKTPLLYALTNVNINRYFIDFFFFY